MCHDGFMRAPHGHLYPLCFLSLIMCLSFTDHYAVFFRISEEEYVKSIKEEIRKVVELQEELDIDVLVHGEPEVRSHFIT